MAVGGLTDTLMAAGGWPSLPPPLPQPAEPAVSTIAITDRARSRTCRDFLAAASSTVRWYAAQDRRQHPADALSARGPASRTCVDVSCIGRSEPCTVIMVTSAACPIGVPECLRH